MAEDIVLETRNLTEEFNGFTAVNIVNLHVRRGDIHALVGPNGADKCGTDFPGKHQQRKLPWQDESCHADGFANNQCKSVRCCRASWSRTKSWRFSHTPRSMSSASNDAITGHESWTPMSRHNRDRRNDHSTGRYCPCCGLQKLHCISITNGECSDQECEGSNSDCREVVAWVIN